MILHIESNNLVKIQNVHRYITSKTTRKHLLTLSDSWCWHQCWCLSYIQVKTSYQEFSKNNQEQKQLFLEDHWLHTQWGTLLREFDQLSFDNHWLSLQMECVRIILLNHPLKTLFTKMQLKRGYTYSSFISVKSETLYFFCLESELLQSTSLLYFFLF